MSSFLGPSSDNVRSTSISALNVEMIRSSFQMNIGALLLLSFSGIVLSSTSGSVCDEIHSEAKKINLRFMKTNESGQEPQMAWMMEIASACAISAYLDPFVSFLDAIRRVSPFIGRTILIDELLSREIRRAADVFHRLAGGDTEGPREIGLIVSRIDGLEGDSRRVGASHDFNVD